MSKWCFNYESGEYEYIDRDGFSIDRGEYVFNWDDSEYEQEERPADFELGRAFSSLLREILLLNF